MWWSYRDPQNRFLPVSVFENDFLHDLYQSPTWVSFSWPDQSITWPKLMRPEAEDIFWFFQIYGTIFCFWLCDSENSIRTRDLQSVPGLWTKISLFTGSELKLLQAAPSKKQSFSPGTGSILQIPMIISCGILSIDSYRILVNSSTVRHSIFIKANLNRSYNILKLIFKIKTEWMQYRMKKGYLYLNLFRFRSLHLVGNSRLFCIEN